MSMKSLFLLCAAALSATVSAQLAVRWSQYVESSHPAFPSSICFDPNGNVLVPYGHADFASPIYRYSASGVGEAFNLTGAYNRALYSSIRSDSEANVYFSGFLYDDTSAETTFLRKIGPSGTGGWGISNLGISLNRYSDMSIDQTGKLIVVGATTINGRRSAMIECYSLNNPTPQWRQIVSRPGADLEVHQIKCNPEGYAFASGTFTEGSIENGYLMKVSPSGELVWEQVLRRVEGNTYIESIAFSSDGGVFVAGGLNNPLSARAFAAKLTAEGILQWFAMPATAEYDTSFCSLAYSSDAGLVAVGNSYHVASRQRDMLLSKFSNDGQVLWSKIIDGGSALTDKAEAIFLSKSGTAYVFGTVASPSRLTDYFAASFSTSGLELSRVYIDRSNGDDVLRTATFDGADNFACSGHSSALRFGHGGLLTAFLTDRSIAPLSALLESGTGSLILDDILADDAREATLFPDASGTISARICLKAPTTALTSLRLRVKGSSVGSGTVRRIEAYDFLSSQYNSLDSIGLPNPDFDDLVPVPVGNYVNPLDGSVSIRIKFSNPTSSRTSARWGGRLNLIKMEYTR